MKISLNSALSTLLTSEEKNMQLDFFRENGQVILQMYKQVDVQTWGYDIDIVDVRGLILELCFSNSKTSNKENLRRFKESSYYVLFKKFPKVEQNSFFMRFRGDEDLSHIVRQISDIIKTIYMLEEFQFSLNAY